MSEATEEIKLYDFDYVLIDGEGEPVEGLDVIYSHAAFADWINTGHVFLPADGEQMVSMTQLPAELQALYLEDITKRQTNEGREMNDKEVKEFLDDLAADPAKSKAFKQWLRKKVSVEINQNQTMAPTYGDKNDPLI